MRIHIIMYYIEPVISNGQSIKLVKSNTILSLPIGFKYDLTLTHEVVIVGGN